MTRRWAEQRASVPGCLITACLQFCSGISSSLTSFAKINTSPVLRKVRSIGDKTSPWYPGVRNRVERQGMVAGKGVRLGRTPTQRGTHETLVIGGRTLFNFCPVSHLHRLCRAAGNNPPTGCRRCRGLEVCGLSPTGAWSEEIEGPKTSSCWFADDSRGLSGFRRETAKSKERTGEIFRERQEEAEDLTITS